MHTVWANGAAGAGTQTLEPAHPVAIDVVWHARPVRDHPNVGTFLVGCPVHVPPVGVGGVILTELPVLHDRDVQLVTEPLKQLVEQFEPV